MNIKKSKDNATYGIAFIIFIGIAILAFTSNNGASSITTYIGEKSQDTASAPNNILREGVGNIDGSLFDIILKIPKEYKYLENKKELLVSVELTNFGKSGKTPVSISYIITNEEGSIVTILHEDRVVETQDTFLKEIDLPKLKYGPYKLFVEMLYSNTSAVAQEVFNVVSIS